MSDRYGIKSCHATVWGEGALSGRKVVVLEFAGCPFWEGGEHQRDDGAVCARICDADFTAGDVLSLDAVLEALEAAWPRRFVDGRDTEQRWAYLTGGEPAAQANDALLAAIGKAGWYVAMETSGAIELCNEAGYIAHLVLSPKPGLPLLVQWCNELKVVLPGAAPGEDGWDLAALPKLVAGLTFAQGRNKRSLFVQPQDPLLSGAPGITLLRPGPEEQSALAEASYRVYLQQCVDWVLSNPEWRLSLQTQKYVDLPLCQERTMSGAVSSDSLMRGLGLLAGAGSGPGPSTTTATVQSAATACL